MSSVFEKEDGNILRKINGSEKTCFIVDPFIGSPLLLFCNL